MKAPIKEKEWTSILGEMGAVWSKHSMHPDEVVQALCRGLCTVFFRVRALGVPKDTVLEKLHQITEELLWTVTDALNEMETGEENARTK